jgi:hypothetical protein
VEDDVVFGTRSGYVIDRRRFLRATAGAMALGAATVAVGKRRAAAPIALGAYVSGAPDNPFLLDQFIGMVGTPPAVVMWYQDWAHSGFDPVRMNAVTSRGLMPMVTWEPWDYTAGTQQPAYALAKIVSGAYDAYIDRWARAAAAWGGTFYLRFAHEMNGNWYPWGAGVNGNTPEQYVAVWQRVVSIFRGAGAANARWVWCPNIAGTSLTRRGGSAADRFHGWYPGDASVHWIGMDGYNWGTSQPQSRWQEIPTIFAATYTALTKLTAKPLMIGETASAEQGGNKADWITTGFLQSIPTRFPRVRAVIWFSEDKEADWRVNSSDAALAAYRGVARSAAYRGKLT